MREDQEHVLQDVVDAANLLLRKGERYSAQSSSSTLPFLSRSINPETATKLQQMLYIASKQLQHERRDAAVDSDQYVHAG